jgi:hypothetical protein
MIAKSYRLLRVIVNTAVVEDELIRSNLCKIKGAGVERPTERPALGITEVYEPVELVSDRWRTLALLTAFAALRGGEVTALTRRTLISRSGRCASDDSSSQCRAESRSARRSHAPASGSFPSQRASAGASTSSGHVLGTCQVWLGLPQGARQAVLAGQLQQGSFLGHLHDLRHAGSRMGHDSTAAAGEPDPIAVTWMAASPPRPRVDTCSQPLTGLGRAAAGGTNSAVINPRRPSPDRDLD